MLAASFCRLECTSVFGNREKELCFHLFNSCAAIVPTSFKVCDVLNRDVADVSCERCAVPSAAPCILKSCKFKHAR